MKQLLIVLAILALCVSLGAQQNFLIHSNSLKLKPPVVTYIINKGDVDAYDTFTIIQPNGGETLWVGSDYTIRWTKQGSQSNSAWLMYSTTGTTNWIGIATVDANSGSYVWNVPNTPSTTCRVRIMDTRDTMETAGDWSDNNFTIARTGFKGNMTSAFIPPVFALTNAPNPFKTSTTIRYSITTTSNVSVKIFDITGKEIVKIKEGKLPAGSYIYTWNAGNVAPGTYICKLTADNKTLIRNITVLK